MSLEKRLQPNAQPLFIQIEGLIEARILEREWSQGETLPSEFAFADYYNVSQGTVRKAINLLAKRNFLERRQGKGTFIKSLTTECEHSHFFHISNRSGEKVVPTTRQLSIKKSSPDKEAQQLLKLAPAAQIVTVERMRIISDQPGILETIKVDANRFPDLDTYLRENTTNELYPLYEQRYGIRILRAEENIEAISANSRHAKHLDIETGSALLKITRVAYSFNDEPVETRRSLLQTKDWCYRSLLER